MSKKLKTVDENDELTEVLEDVGIPPILPRLVKHLAPWLIAALAILVLVVAVRNSGYRKAEEKYKAEMAAELTKKDKEISEKDNKIKKQDEEIKTLKDEIEWLERIDLGIVKEKVSSIGELASAEYRYTNSGRFEDAKKLLGIRLPWTEKFFILRYDGTIKVGFDITNPDVQVNGNTVTVTLPQPKVLSHEVDFKSAEVLDERNGLFNPVTVSDVNDFYAQNADSMNLKVMESELKVAALTNARALITNLLSSYPAVHNVEVRTASS